MGEPFRRFRTLTLGVVRPNINSVRFAFRQLALSTIWDAAWIGISIFWVIVPQAMGSTED